MAGGSTFADSERRDLRFLVRFFQPVARLPHQIRNVDAGEWIGAFHDQEIARPHAGERLARAQRREGAFEAAQVEGLFRHGARVAGTANRFYH